MATPKARPDQPARCRWLDWLSGIDLAPEPPAGLPTVKWVFVTPEIAARWLGKDVNVKNRNKVPLHIKRMADDIISGHWKINGDTIRFDITGRLVDGQNRLEAIIRSGIGYWALIVGDLGDDVFESIDRGVNKQVAHSLTAMGYSNAALLAAAGRLVHIWEEGTLAFAYAPAYAPSAAEILATIRSHPALRDSAHWVASHRESFYLAPSMAALIHYTSILANRKELAETFLDQVFSGLRLENTYPAFHLRRFMETQRNERRRASTSHIFHMAVKAWQLHVLGKPCRSLRTTETEPFPELP